MLTKEDIEIIASNFEHEYFLHYDLGDWKQIINYKEDIPKIIRLVVLQMKGYKDRELFKVIMDDIDNVDVLK